MVTVYKVFVNVKGKLNSVNWPVLPDSYQTIYKSNIKTSFPVYAFKDLAIAQSFQKARLVPSELWQCTADNVLADHPSFVDGPGNTRLPAIADEGMLGNLERMIAFWQGELSGVPAGFGTIVCTGLKPVVRIS